MFCERKLWLFLVVVVALLVAVTATAKWEAIDGPPVGVGTDVSVCLDSGTEYVYLTSNSNQIPGPDDYPYVSSNGGNSWTRLDDDSKVEGAHRVAADPTDHWVVYIARDGGVFKSIDGGHSFSKAGQNQITNEDVIDLEMDPSSSDTVWCVSQWAQGEDVLFRTENAGDSWSVISPPNDTAQIQTVEVDPITSDTVFLGAAEGDKAHLRGVYRSTNFGSTWSHTLDSAYIYTIAVSADSNAFVFAGGKPSSGSGGIIYKSTDNGQTWDSGTSFDGEVKAIASDPTNYQKAYAATDSGAYKTTDGGSNWVAFEDGDEPYCDVFLSCAVSPDSTHIVYFGGKFSVYRASASTGDWVEITSGMSPGESNAIAVLLPNIWVFNDFHTLHESTDGGSTWKTVWYEAEDNDLIKEIALDPDMRSGEYTMYAIHHDSSTNRDNIVKSIDTGRTWSSVFDPGVSDALAYCVVVDTLSTNNATIYATYSSEVHDSVVMRSENSGADWTAIGEDLPSAKDVYCLAFRPDTNGFLFVGVEDNGVYRSTDGGDN
jgi:photosystem II stability/assembly factor-like uncharacterized protein